MFDSSELKVPATTFPIPIPAFLVFVDTNRGELI
jgi:hypothetical protein